MIRIRKIFTPLLTLAVICAAPVMAIAQSVTLSGKVVDAQDRPIENAVVMVKHGGNLLASARTLTNAQGNFGTFKDAVVELDKSGALSLVVRKAGYLPSTKAISDLSGNAGTITLERDPIEDRIDAIMADMTMPDKIYQMTQAQANDGANAAGPYGVTGVSGNYLYGSVLRGGDGHAGAHLRNLPPTLSGWQSNVKIPVVYGKDAVHGNAGIPGYTVFPHNIGLGATRDSTLVRLIGEATAKEMWAAGINMNFSPAISVARDARWGRTYESYGERPELHISLGAAMVRGLQGERFDASWRVIATAKHFVGDGATEYGTGVSNRMDRGDANITDDEIRAIHLPGYEAVVEQGVLSVMASFNRINGVHQHVDFERLTNWLKIELGFDGYIISDWLGIGNSEWPGTSGGYDPTPGSREETSETAIKAAINAGIDLAMEPNTYTSFVTGLTNLVNSGDVPQERIDDAVRRILRAKFRAGIMDDISAAGPLEFLYNDANRAQNADHQLLAREAVRKSLVLLKNENTALPLAKNANIHVFGSNHDDIGRQCGGWTVAWGGVTGNSGFIGGMFGSPRVDYDFTPYGTSILQGMQQVTQGEGGTIDASAAANTSTDANVIVYVTGERPYAEWNGDIPSLDFPVPAADMNALRAFKEQGKKIITIFVSGRPMIVTDLINVSDAFVAAWLPGTQGIGVADALFGVHPFTGRLPITWPGSSGTQFEYGYAWGVASSIAAHDRNIPAPPNDNNAAVIPSAVTMNALTAGPNPVAKIAGGVSFFWQGAGIQNGTLAIYDASGNLIKKVSVKDADGTADTSGRRAVGGWDFTDRKGREVAAGNYLVKGTVKTRGGKREKVSVVLSVR